MRQNPSVPEAVPGLPAAMKTVTTLFVVGVFRSGTSLLYALLNQHPDIALMYECDVWSFPRILSPLRFRHDWPERLEFYTNALSRHHLAGRKDVCGVKHARTPQDIYRAFALSKGARIIGEKSPSYCNRLGQLAQNQPGSTFLLIWRDPVEIYRSVEDAAPSSRYFRQRGMLDRLIFYHEEMIMGAANLVRSGNRVHHVTYADLTARTQETCRGICRFLGIEFDLRMASLAGADLSAVNQAPHFEHLRLGKIGRRVTGNRAAPQVVRKLQRFQNRWNRLRQELLNLQSGSTAGHEPGIIERVRYRFTGRLLYGRDSAIRVGFEFLPLPWLRTYRQAKAWFSEGRSAHEQRPSIWEDFATHKTTILASLIVLGFVAFADYFTGAAVSLMPFYVIPAVILTLVINRRWGTFGAVLSALVWAFLQNVDNPLINLAHVRIWVWDAFMRFLVIEFVVLLLERVRLEIKSTKPVND